MKHVVEFLEFAGCFLLWVTYLVILRTVAHAKRPGPTALDKRSEAAAGEHREKSVVRSAAKSVA